VIVHLGLGAFHRAHQAVYTQDTGWEICGVAHRRRTIVDALRAHDWRYTVISRGPDKDEQREITVIKDALVAADEPDEVVRRITGADLVTLTITEGAYERGGMLDLLARGIAKRTKPLTVISCDNVPRNGEVLRELLGDVATFPCTMVDRIVPTPEDPLTVVAEPFSQWVIEEFDGPRPDWPGVEMVPDSRPHELTKLRLLNGTHSALAALATTHETVAEAIADPEIFDFVRRLLDEELLLTVDAPDGYVDTMLERFRNPRIEHRLEKIATGAEHKIAQRLIPAAEELKAAGKEPRLINEIVRRALH
jgi:fructuronate reductase